MNNQQRVRLKIKKRFLSTIYIDAIIGICLLAVIILLPLALSKTFSPQLIYEMGQFSAWGIWFIGTILVLGLIVAIIALIYGWIKCRWKKSEEHVLNQIIINENARRH